jgi:hypothetical protein
LDAGPGLQYRFWRGVRVFAADVVRHQSLPQDSKTTAAFFGTSLTLPLCRFAVLLPADLGWTKLDDRHAKPSGAWRMLPGRGP